MRDLYNTIKLVNKLREKARKQFYNNELELEICFKQGFINGVDQVYVGIWNPKKTEWVANKQCDLVKTYQENKAEILETFEKMVEEFNKLMGELS
jgi:hypothetical protein